MSREKEVPPRRKRPGKDPDFHYVRVQNVPESVTQGYDPVYAMDEQAQRYAGPDAEYVRDEEMSGKAFSFYKIPKSDYEKIEKGLQDKANARLQRPDHNLTSRTEAGMVKPIDTITMEPQTLDQVGASLPNRSQ